MKKAGKKKRVNICMCAFFFVVMTLIVERELLIFYEVRKEDQAISLLFFLK